MQSSLKLSRNWIFLHVCSRAVVQRSLPDWMARVTYVRVAESPAVRLSNESPGRIAARKNQRFSGEILVLMQKILGFKPAHLGLDGFFAAELL
ncbi:hypothetical protein SLE2022_211600 [Rubroshorea leprosula]